MLHNDPWNVCASFQDRTRWNNVNFFEFVRLSLPYHAETENYFFQYENDVFTSAFRDVKIVNLSSS